MQLNLRYNYIGHEGSRYLSQALKYNTVSFQILFHFDEILLFLIFVDAHTPQSCK